MSESQSANAASSSKSESALATKLLSLWAHGLLSATVIRELAHLALLDGANHDELVALAKAGNFGEQPGNISRDIMTKFCKQVSLNDPTTVKVLGVGPKSSTEEEVEAGCFLPHLIFSIIGN